MRPTKIRLSPAEKLLILDADWILTKRSIMDKVGTLLGEVAEGYRARAEHAVALTPELKGRFPKLSRGENYQGLPYMILDYPAVFDREHVFAIRTLFWWGRYFSLTLHLKGRYRDRYVPPLLGRPLENWYLAVSEDEWVHAVQEPDYKRAHELSETEWAAQGDRVFFKMVTVIPLDQWDNIADLLEQRFGELLDAVNVAGT
jgi:hypothetical protein